MLHVECGLGVFVVVVCWIVVRCEVLEYVCFVDFVLCCDRCGYCEYYFCVV